MGIVDLRTNLKSLRYGKDTVGGGNSGQPFVTRAIPDDLSDVGRTGGPDFLLRGGTLLPRIVLNDAIRISKLFYPGKGRDINTTNNDDPQGIDASNNGRRPVNLIGTLFTAKQNILSLTNVNSGAGYEPFVQAERDVEGNFFQRAGSAISTFVKNNVALNQGIYTPLSTIGQTVGGALGLHLNKQGLNPNQNTTIGAEDGNTPLGLPTYLNTIATGGDKGNKSRLEPLLSKINTNTGGDQNLYTYSGGPGATLGVGQTNIDMKSEYRTGENNAKKLFWDNKKTPQFVSNKRIFLGKDGFNDPPFSLSFIAPQLIYSSLEPIFAAQFFREDYLDTRNASVYKPGTLLETDTNKLKSGINGTVPRQVWTQAEIEAKVPFSKTNDANQIKDFRKEIKDNGNQIPNSLPYIDENKFEQRVNLGNPGKKGNISSYSIGFRDGTNSLAEKNEVSSIKANSGYKYALDKINAYPLYQSTAVTGDDTKNDFVKFRIGIIDNENPTLKTYIHFRAIIDSLTDNYSANWDEQKYMGRGEKFYNYQGFDRSIALGWTVAAQSKQELIPMYQKLNLLASSLAPNYSKSGYMRGNLVTLTIGGWCFEQPGIIQGMQLGVPTESPWEIAIPDGPNIETVGEGENEIKTDKSVKEMPMIVSVTGFTFKPIHNFIPQLQNNEYKGKDGFISKYGKERFIALSNGYNNNYSANNYIPKK